MSGLFNQCGFFNQNIGNWDVSNVEIMIATFAGASSFNQDLSSWNVNKVTNMIGLFSEAESFNQNLSEWNTANVVDMSFLFSGASSFNQDIGAWDVSNVNSMQNMFPDSGLSNENYDNMLIGWSQLPSLQNGVQFDAPENLFCSAKDARQSIIDTYGWTINDAGESADCNIVVDCPHTLVNEEESIVLPIGNGFLGVDEAIGTSEVTNNSDCAFALVNRDSNEPFANYRIPIDLAFYGFEAGDELFISLDGNSSEGTGRIEVLRNNTPNQASFSHTFEGGWSTISETIVVPEGVSSLDIWLYSNYLSNGPGTAYYDNLIVRRVGDPLQRPFITTWKTYNPGVSEDNQITIPVFPGETYDYTVDWGDGSTSENVTGVITHTYESLGIYTISITGDYPRSYFDYTGEIINDAQKLLSVDQWGDIQWSSMFNAFFGCENMDVLATDTPDLSRVFSTGAMFRFCPSLIGNASFENWDVSNVQAMFSMFDGATLFNQDIGNWDVGQVRSIGGIFRDAQNFNQDIGEWNMENVESTFLMFSGANSFNQDISGWDVSNVTDMLGMFQQTTTFNQDISSWNVSNVTNMLGMFDAATSFNQPLNNWDVSNVTTMFAMFTNAAAFNQPLSDWDVSNVTDMINLFREATSFDQDLSNWNVGKVESMIDIFRDTGLSDENYDKALIGWSQLPTLQNNVVLDAQNNAFCKAAEARQLIIDTYGWIINDLGEAIACGSGNNRPFVTTWKTDNPGGSEDNQITIPTFPGETYNYTVEWGDGTTSENVDGDITHTYLASGTYTVTISGDFPRIYFRGFNSRDTHKILEVSQWGNIEWTSFESSFHGCINMDIIAQDKPDLSKVQSMKSAFELCRNLVGNEKIGTWDISSVIDIQGIFDRAVKFNQDIGEWDTSNVQFMSNAFQDNPSFNQDLSRWNTENVVSMDFMFDGATEFNGNISTWKTGKVEFFGSMFRNAISFNQEISDWDVSSAKGMSSMFTSAESFNQDISNWDVTNVTTMDRMFWFASSFDQNLGDWDINNVFFMSFFFSESGISNQNYDKSLIGWSQLPSLQNRVQLDAFQSQFCEAAEARQLIIDTYSWIINDAGESIDCNIEVDCPNTLSNEDETIVLPVGSSFLGIDEINGTSEVTNGSDCAFALVNNDSGEIFANYRIPIDLATYDINPGDNLFISLDGNSSEGVARIEVLRDNTPNQAAFSQTFVGGWGTVSTTIVVPAGLTSLDIWLYSNYLSNEPGTVYYDNLVVTNLGPNAVPVQANTMSLFPNPANESVSMTFKAPTKVIEFQVFDVSGRLIRTVKMDKRSQEYNLNVSDLQPGTYFIQTMDTKGQIYDKQMIIER